MVLVKQNKFSVERFESVMLLAGVTWDELNKELEFDVKKHLKAKNKPPMKNVIGKACDYIGLEDSEYVMMNTNTYSLKSQKNEYEKEVLSTSVIDLELFNLLLKESEWSSNSISTILSTTSLKNGTKYYARDIKTIKRNDLYNICWALNCTIGDICTNLPKNILNFKPVDRILNDRQKYLLNKETLNRFENKLGAICKHANVPVEFIKSNPYISQEMVMILCGAIFKITAEQVSGFELCINYNTDSNLKRGGINNIKMDKMQKALNLLDAGYNYEQVTKMTNISHNALKRAKLIELSRGIKKEEQKMEIPATVKAAIKEENKKEVKEMKAQVVKETKTTTINNNQTSSFMSDVFYKIDRMTDDELEKVQQYLEASKKLRELKNSLLG